MLSRQLQRKPAAQPKARSVSVRPPGSGRRAHQPRTLRPLHASAKDSISSKMSTEEEKKKLISDSIRGIPGA